MSTAKKIKLMHTPEKVLQLREQRLFELPLAMVKVKSYNQQLDELDLQLRAARLVACYCCHDEADLQARYDHIWNLSQDFKYEVYTHVRFLN
ncbi:hypothetical protein [Mucilaginibacter sp. CSA2-8R]|uniref:hypothetical protein n=1 Tax=Mucilaginibacter sp. CSA2-8R TaxID=3141542 RepID=UPI00315D2238